MIAVGICTFRRPAVLGALLERLHAIGAAVDDDVVVIVVDDDAERSAEATVAAFAERFAGDVAYVSTGSGNISVARNRVLTEASARADFVALTDDDCEPEVGWLADLVRVQRRWHSDIVSGHCIDVVPDGAPRSFGDTPWFATPPAHTDGEVIDVAWIKNTLLRLAAIDGVGLRFDPAFGATGGEDTMFFYTAAALGLEHRFAAGAIVREMIPLERTQLRYQLARAIWYGNSAANTSISAGRINRLRAGVRGVRQIARAGGALVGAVVRRRPSEWRMRLADALAGTGMVLRFLGLRMRHSTVDALAHPGRRR